MNFETVVQAVVVAGITAVVTAYVATKVLEARMNDFIHRIARIESFLNGLLRNYKMPGEK